jgi:hypothetical protein
MQVVVTGFRHSGASLVTPLLRRAGLDLGPDAGARRDGDCDGYEDPHVRRLHRAVLDRHGPHDGSSPFPYFIGRDHWNRMRQLVRRRDLAHDVWGFEDPDAALFLGAWKHVMPDSRFVLVFRDPRSCLRSWSACPAGHGGSSATGDHGLRRWDTHNRAMLAFARARVDDCLLVSYDDLLAGRPVVDEVRGRLGVPLDRGSATEAASSEDPTPQHQDEDEDGDEDGDEAGTSVVAPETTARVRQTWDALVELATRTES